MTRVNKCRLGQGLVVWHCSMSFSLQMCLNANEINIVIIHSNRLGVSVQVNQDSEQINKYP